MSNMLNVAVSDLSSKANIYFLIYTSLVGIDL